jgi:VIT1/CCC1 family predicted Fe2+/Mn2+ transporter
MANEVEIPLKLSGVQSLKAELRSLKAAIAEASDPEQMAALAARAGEVADRIKDANDAVNVFASGSKFEQISNSFGGIRDSLMSLDFEEASTKAQTFSKTLGSLNAADISKGIKGLTSTITTMGGAFVKLGAQILVNPIFLLAAVVTAIVVAIGVWLNKIGVLQKAIDFLMIPVNLLIDAFKELTDWLGLTSYAAEENARKMEKANEKAFKSSEKRVAAISDSYDIEIAKAKAAGKDTTDLELKKSKAISDAAKKRLADARDEYAQLKGLSDKDSIERRKALRKRIEEENKLIKDGSKERQLIQIADDAEQKAKEDKAAEEAKAKREEAAKKYKEGKAAIQAEIAAANKLVLDSNKTQEQKEIDDVKAKYAKLIAEAKKYKQDVTALTAAQDLEINNIRKDGADELVKLETKKASEVSQILVDSRTKSLQIQGEGNMASFEEQKKYNEAVIAAEESLAQAKLGAAKGLISGLTELAGENKKLANALFLVDKALAIGEIIVNTQKEISGYYANPLWKALPDGGLALASAAAAGAKIRAATSIGTIVASSISKFMGGGGASVQTPSAGGGGGASANVGSASVPSFVPGNLFGQGNAANNATSAQGVETGATITVNAVVSETEMTGVQNKVNKILKNAVL